MSVEKGQKIRADHRRRKRLTQKDLSDDQMFDLDSSIFMKTEDKKDGCPDLIEKHKKKLADITHRRSGHQNRKWSYKQERTEEK